MYALKKKLISLLLSLSLALSAITLPAIAEWSLQDMNPTPDSAELYGRGYDVQAVISLTEDQTIVVSMPTTMTAEELANADITYSLTRNPGRPYLEPTLFPHQHLGGPIDSWLTEAGDPLFTVTSASIADESWVI